MGVPGIVGLGIPGHGIREEQAALHHAEMAQLGKSLGIEDRIMGDRVGVGFTRQQHHVRRRGDDFRRGIAAKNQHPHLQAG